MNVRTTIFTIVLLLLVSGCALIESADTAPARGVPIVDAMANDVVFQPNPVTREPNEAVCIAEGIYAEIGAARLAEAGVTVSAPNPANGDLTDAEQAVVASVEAACIGGPIRTAPVTTTAPLTTEGTDSTSDTADEPSAATNSEPSASEATANPSDVRREQVIEEMAVGIANDPELPVPYSEALCMARTIIDGLGLSGDALEDFANDDSDEEPTRAEYNIFVDAMGSCTDVIASFTTGLAAAGFYDAEAVCIATEFGRPRIMQLLRAEYDLGPNDDVPPAMAVELDLAVDRCGIVFD